MRGVRESGSAAGGVLGCGFAAARVLSVALAAGDVVDVVGAGVAASHPVSARQASRAALAVVVGMPTGSQRRRVTGMRTAVKAMLITVEIFHFADYHRPCGAQRCSRWSAAWEAS